MAVTPSTGMSDADIHFNIEDDITRETLRQLFDNTRKLREEHLVLKERVDELEGINTSESDISLLIG